MHCESEIRVHHVLLCLHGPDLQVDHMFLPYLMMMANSQLYWDKMYLDWTYKLSIPTQKSWAEKNMLKLRKPFSVLIFAG